MKRRKFIKGAAVTGVAATGVTVGGGSTEIKGRGKGTPIEQPASDKGSSPSYERGSDEAVGDEKKKPRAPKSRQLHGRLKQLNRHFGKRPKKALIIARSNWGDQSWRREFLINERRNGWHLVCHEPDNSYHDKYLVFFLA